MTDTPRKVMLRRARQRKYAAKLTGTYWTWKSMKQRCLNPNAPSYRYYGARGISIYEPWLEYQNFLADMGERPEGMTLDRIDNNGDYGPDNCRWATWKTQHRDKNRVNAVRNERGQFAKHTTPTPGAE